MWMWYQMEMKPRFRVRNEVNMEDNKWIINVESKDFTDKIWQCEDSFTSEQLNEVINEWANKVQDILICLSDEKSTEEILEKIDNDYYPLGDLVNFLDNIKINITKQRILKQEEKRFVMTEKYTLLLIIWKILNYIIVIA